MWNLKPDRLEAPQVSANTDGTALRQLNSALRMMGGAIQHYGDKAREDRLLAEKRAFQEKLLNRRIARGDSNFSSMYKKYRGKGSELMTAEDWLAYKSAKSNLVALRGDPNATPEQINAAENEIRYYDKILLNDPKLSKRLQYEYMKAANPGYLGRNYSGKVREVVRRNNTPAVDKLKKKKERSFWNEIARGAVNTWNYLTN